jgi:hypothetical protein
MKICLQNLGLYNPGPFSLLSRSPIIVQNQATFGLLPPPGVTIPGGAGSNTPDSKPQAQDEVFHHVILWNLPALQVEVASLLVELLERIPCIFWQGTKYSSINA